MVCRGSCSASVFAEDSSSTSGMPLFGTLILVLGLATLLVAGLVMKRKSLIVESNASQSMQVEVVSANEHPTETRHKNSDRPSGVYNSFRSRLRLSQFTSRSTVALGGSFWRTVPGTGGVAVAAPGQVRNRPMDPPPPITSQEIKKRRERQKISVRQRIQNFEALARRPALRKGSKRKRKFQKQQSKEPSGQMNDKNVSL